jgi:hypothetical protein
MYVLLRLELLFSATFAKRADNMPLYAMKTCIAEAQLIQNPS